MFSLPSFTWQPWGLQLMGLFIWPLSAGYGGPTPWNIQWMQNNILDANESAKGTYDLGLALLINTRQQKIIG